MTRNPRTISTAVMVVLLVLASGTAVSLATPGETSAATDTELTSLNQEETNQTEANVTIADQESDGERIIVESATLPEGGFIAIHNESLLEGEAVDSVVGASVYLEPGTYENLSVTLAEPINESQTLIAMPHQDTNDNLVYDFVIGEGDVDDPYTMDGEAVTDDAEITIAEPTDEEEQPEANVSNEFTFQVEQLDIDQWSFVVGEGEPNRTVTASGFDLQDETVNVNVTDLLAGADVEDAVQRAQDADEEDVQAAADQAQQAAEEANVSMPGQLQTTRVVISDVTVENVTFNVELPPGAQLPAVPGMPGGPADEEAAPLAANVTFENQTTTGETVNVDSVNMSRGGFVVIHDRGLLQGDAVGSVVGSSQYLEPGVHEDVTVTLDEPLNETQTLIAMPHLDTNDNQVYDFSSSDGTEDIPYVVDNRVVIDPALVTVEAAEETTTTTTAETTTAETTTPAETTTTAATETTTTVAEETTTPVETTTAVEETTTVAEETTTPEETTTVAEETTTPVETTTVAEETTTPEETTTVAEETTTPAETTTAAAAEVEDVTDLGPSLDVVDLEAPLNATVGETLTVNATITNPTDEALTQPVDFRLGGDVIQRKNVSLGPGENTSITYEIDTSDVAPGTYTHGVYTRNFGQIAAITLESPETTTPAETTTAAEETTTVAEETTTAVEETTTVAEETTTAVEETTTAVPEETTAVAEETTAAVETTTVADETTAAAETTAVAEETTTEAGTTTAAA